MRKALWFGVGLATGVLLAMFLIVVAVEAAEPAQAPAQESNWGNLARLPGGTLVIVEDIDGKLHRGCFVGMADDAISIRQRKRIRGIPRDRVERVWLLGGRKIAKGAAVGALSLGLIGALTYGIAGASSGESGEGAAGAIGGGLMFAGIGAGIGAAIGVGVRKRTLIYRAPPSLSPAQPNPPPASAFPSTASLPPPLRTAYRPFCAREAVNEITWESGRRKPDGH